MSATEVCLRINGHGNPEGLVELPSQILVDLEAHIEQGLGQSLEGCIRGLLLRQKGEDFEQRRFTCITELQPHPRYAPLLARLLACVPVVLSSDDLLERYGFYFPLHVQGKDSEKGIDSVQSMELASKIVDSPTLSGAIRAYGMRPERCSSQQEAEAFLARLTKRVQFLFDHQFPPIREYFGSPSHVIQSKKTLSEFFSADHCRNILVVHQLLTRKSPSEVFIRPSLILKEFSGTPVQTLRMAAERCVLEWEERGISSSERAPFIMDLSTDIFAPETGALTKIPSELIKTLGERGSYCGMTIANQHLFTLPRGMGTLPLVALDVSGNLFEELSANLFEIKTLRYLFAKENLFTSISEECADSLRSLQGYGFDEDVVGVPPEQAKNIIQQLKDVEDSGLPGFRIYPFFAMGKEELDEYREHYRQKM